MKISILRKLAMLAIPAVMLTLTGCIIVSIEKPHHVDHIDRGEVWVEVEAEPAGG